MQTFLQHWWLVEKTSCIASAQHKLNVVQTVNGWSLELKRQLIHFWTGSDRLPQPLTEALYVELPFVAFNRQEHMTMLTRLPQVSLHITTSHCLHQQRMYSQDECFCLSIIARAETHIIACNAAHLVTLLNLLGSKSEIGKTC